MIKIFLMVLSIFVMLSDVQASAPAEPQRTSGLREAFRRKPTQPVIQHPHQYEGAPAPSRTGKRDEYTPSPEFESQVQLRREALGEKLFAKNSRHENEKMLTDLGARKQYFMNEIAAQTVKEVELAATVEKIGEGIESRVWGWMRKVPLIGGKIAGQETPESQAARVAQAPWKHSLDSLKGDIRGQKGYLESLNESLAIFERNKGRLDNPRISEKQKTDIHKQIYGEMRGQQKAKLSQDPAYQRIQAVKTGELKVVMGDPSAFVALAQRYVLKVRMLENYKSTLIDVVSKFKGKIFKLRKIIKLIESDPQLFQQAAPVRLLDAMIQLNPNQQTNFLTPEEAALHQDERYRISNQKLNMLGHSRVEQINAQIRQGAGELLTYLKNSVTQYAEAINYFIPIINELSIDINLYKQKQHAIFAQHVDAVKTLENESIRYVLTKSERIKALSTRLNDLRSRNGDLREIKEVQDEIQRQQGKIDERKEKIENTALFNQVVHEATAALKPLTEEEVSGKALQTYNPDAKEAKDITDLIQALTNLTLIDTEAFSAQITDELVKDVNGFLSPRIYKKITKKGADKALGIFVGQLQGLLAAQAANANQQLNQNNPHILFLNKITELQNINNQIQRTRDRAELSRLKQQQKRLQQEIKSMSAKLKSNLVGGRKASGNQAQRYQEAQSDVVDVIVAVTQATEGPAMQYAHQMIDQYTRRNATGNATMMGGLFNFGAGHATDFLIPILNGVAVAQLESMHQDPTRAPITNVKTAELLTKRLSYAKNSKERKAINVQILRVYRDINSHLTELKGMLYDLGQNPTSDKVKAAAKKAKILQQAHADFQAGTPVEPRRSRPSLGGHRHNPEQEFGEAPPPPPSLRPPSMAGEHRLRAASQEFGEAPPPLPSVRPPSMSGHRSSTPSLRPPSMSEHRLRPPSLRPPSMG